LGRLSNHREERGLSLREASLQTGIPIDLLAALETEEGAPLAPGGYAERCLIRYEQFLGIEAQERLDTNEDTQITTEHLSTDPGHRERVPLTRLVLVGFSLVAIAILGARLVSMAIEKPGGKERKAAVAGNTADLQVSVRANDDSHLVVHVDGALVFDGDVKARQVVRYAGGDEVAVEIPDLTRVVVTFNGSRVEPLGNLSAGRRLVFIDDGT
jgi:hypothetical protein